MMAVEVKGGEAGQTRVVRQRPRAKLLLTEKAGV